VGKRRRNWEGGLEVDWIGDVGERCRERGLSATAAHCNHHLPLLHGPYPHSQEMKWQQFDRVLSTATVDRKRAIDRDESFIGSVQEELLKQHKIPLKIWAEDFFSK
jgi:hypothetical protein